MLLTRQFCWRNGRHFADDTFKRIFLNENVRIAIKISLKWVSEGPINNIPALVQIMAWSRPGDKPLSEPMMVRLIHGGWGKIADILQTTFSSTFSSMKMVEFWLKFHWSLFLRVQLTISKHWSGTEINFIDMEQISHKTQEQKWPWQGANNKLCITYLILNREQNFAPTLSNLGSFRAN